MSVVKPFGPFSRDEFMAFRDAPFGKFKAAMRKHDPLYGLEYEGELARFKVTIVKYEKVKFRGSVMVVAPDTTTAESLAWKLFDEGGTHEQFKWVEHGTSGCDDAEVECVEGAP